MDKKEIKVIDETILPGRSRLDQYLSDNLPEYSRAYLKTLILDNQIYLNHFPCTIPKTQVHPFDVIEVLIPSPIEMEISPENIPLDILYEDDCLLIVNKPKNMVVHPAAGNMEHTLVNALLYHCKDNLSGINGVLRPGIVHRIDKNTTGSIVICKNDMAHQSLSEQLSEHSITRKYVAIIHGNMKDESGTIDAPIGRHPIHRKKMAINHEHGKRAVTHYKVLNHLNKKYNLIECQLETGRTHQIRVHMSSIGHPILGDDIYGPKTKDKTLIGQCLHARTLGFIHPKTGEYVEFDAPLPDYFMQLISKFREI